MKKINTKKSNIIKDLVQKIKEYKIIGIFDVNDLPSYQLQQIRRSLRNKNTIIKITKKTLIEHALKECENVKKNITDLIKYIDGQVGILFSNSNPFELYKILKQSRTPNFAKPGQKATKEIIIPSGPTPFAPGPIIGELGKFGIKTGVEKGKVVIKEDKVVAKPNDVISAELAQILMRLNIQPMEVGLNLHAVYEDGIIYEGAILDIDESYYKNVLISLSQEALGLSLSIGYICQDNAHYILGNILRESLSLAMEIDYMTKETVEDLLSKYHSIASYLSNLVS
ncbi:MAG: 50S ribosomal protein L10 [Candidatus Woesearchaeota archaeon]